MGPREGVVEAAISVEGCVYRFQAPSNVPAVTCVPQMHGSSQLALAKGSFVGSLIFFLAASRLPQGEGGRFSRAAVTDMCAWCSRPQQWRALICFTVLFGYGGRLCCRHVKWPLHAPPSLWQCEEADCGSVSLFLSALIVGVGIIVPTEGKCTFLRPNLYTSLPISIFCVLYLILPS